MQPANWRVDSQVLYHHPSGNDRIFIVDSFEEHGINVRNADSADKEFWSDNFLTRETERGNLYLVRVV